MMLLLDLVLLFLQSLELLVAMISFYFTNVFPMSDHSFYDVAALFEVFVVTKGQLILKCPFGVKTSSKKPTKFFPGILP